MPGALGALGSSQCAVRFWRFWRFCGSFYHDFGAEYRIESCTSPCFDPRGVIALDPRLLHATRGGTGIKSWIRFLICAPTAPNPIPDRRSARGGIPAAAVSPGAGRGRPAGTARSRAHSPCSNSCDLRVLERRVAIFSGGQSPLDSAVRRGAGTKPNPISDLRPYSAKSGY